MLAALVTEVFGARVERADADVEPRTEISPDHLYLQHECGCVPATRQINMNPKQSQQRKRPDVKGQ